MHEEDLDGRQNARGDPDAFWTHEGRESLPRRAGRPRSSGRMERNGVPTRVTRLFFQASPRNMA